jgi:hypothetical protein
MMTEVLSSLVAMNAKSPLPQKIPADQGGG